MRYWLMKSEPSDVSIDDLASMPEQSVAWYGVRNYQARNFMRDQMRVGDQVFFYHSSCPEPGIVGIAEVCKLAYPKATSQNPRWFNVDVKFVRKTRLVGIKELRSRPELGGMRILQAGNRLSITPVDPAEWNFIMGII
jgi:predicted RNA-binding protein with PUA-like domain